MKTILLATDFSPAAYNAMEYAVEMSKLSKATLILYHTYHIPLVSTEVPLPMPSLTDMERDCMEVLGKYAREINAMHGEGLTVECKCSCGFAADEIDILARECKPDLIIVGMRGAGILSQKLLGSVATTLIRRTAFPVLVIGDKVRFRSIKKIALACDFDETPVTAMFAPLKEIVQLFRSQVYVLNVVKELEPITTPKAVEGLRLEHALEGVDHSYQFVYNDDVENGIDDFIKKQNVDLLVMIPHDKGVFGNIFGTHHTRNEAFHTQIPLLAVKG